MAAAPELREELEQRLRDLGIATVTAEHPEVFTVEEMMPHVQHMKGGHSKNLFLKDKKKKGFWLVTLLHNRQINLTDLAKKLGVGSGNLRFADENSMLEKLKVGQGCATPLALFCDQGESFSATGMQTSVPASLLTEELEGVTLLRVPDLCW
ncbi:prolyl-tRNA synthetase associated domain-containing protein 1-like isoform 2-T2 [Amazona ochrocephala]